MIKEKFLGHLSWLFDFKTKGWSFVVFGVASNTAFSILVVLWSMIAGDTSILTGLVSMIGLAYVTILVYRIADGIKQKEDATNG